MPRGLEDLGQTVKKDAYTGLSLDSESRRAGMAVGGKDLALGAPLSS